MRLYDIIKIILDDISKSGSTYYKIKASEFLYQIINSELHDSYRSILNSDQLLKSLFESDKYRPYQMIPIALNKLIAPTGFMIKASINPGQEYYYVIEAPTNKCILWYGLISSDGISFKIERIDTPEVIFFEDQLSDTAKVNNESILLENAGLYKLTWSNSYSWFTSKNIKFNVSMLCPINNDTSYKSLITANSIPIGIWFKTDITIFYQENQYKLEELAQVYDIINNLSENAEVIVGIIAKSIEIIPKLDVKNINVCLDSKALALIGGEYFMNTLIIAMVIEDGIRMSINYKQEIISTRVFDTNADVIQELGNALCVFGPGIVLISGTYNLLIENIEKELTNFVPDEILQQTYIKESNKLLIIAASRLHLYKRRLLDNWI